MTLNLSFGEAVQGCVRELSFRVQDVCERCSGTKAEPGTKRSKCPYCGGRGEVHYFVGVTLSNASLLGSDKYRFLSHEESMS